MKLVIMSPCHGDDGYFFIGNAGTNDRIYIRTSGNVYNTNNVYSAISDSKLKESIVDSSPKLDKLMQVKVRSYTLIADQSKLKQIGVVAQELEEVFPSMVEEITLPDDSDTIKTVKYSVFVPILIKAIQELNAKVTALEAKVGVI